jgi:ubiquitin-conjugating enzyme E2 C
VLDARTYTDLSCSASPLNGQAAELWDTNMDEFKRNVLARHQDLTDEEME